ncbi:hypothetical protein [Amycolatopsis sp. NPDC004378]
MNSANATVLPEFPDDALRLAELHHLSPAIADVVLTVANEAITTKYAKNLEDLAFEIEGELDEPDRPNSGPIAEDAMHLLGYSYDH